MNKQLYTLSLVVLIISSCTMNNTKENAQSSTAEQEMDKYAIVIHGGAGTFQRAKDDDQSRRRYKRAMKSALDTGRSMLERGASSLEVVEAVIKILESDTLFNAGRGAVLTHEGEYELDASIMEGSEKKAGAVGGVTTVKHPISAARKVMEESPHVFLVSDGAEQFAELRGLDMVSPDYFETTGSKKALKRRKAKEEGMGKTETKNRQEKLGTVGTVALDQKGTIAAGTSTGGMTDKKWGRIGDSPIIGAGTYADNATCGVSCTGHGEYFIRYAVAHDLSARMKHGGQTLERAADDIIHDELEEAGGAGGLIALDREGNISMEFNTSAMLRAYATPEKSAIEIFHEE